VPQTLFGASLPDSSYLDGFEVVFGPQTSWKVENTLETGCAKLGCTLITLRTPPSRVPPQGVHSVPGHSMSIPPSLLSLNGNSEVVRDHEMRRAMKANVVDKMAVTPRLDLWGPLEHYPF
jgi:hypothetical protein